MKKYLNLLFALTLCLSLVGVSFVIDTPVSANDGTGTISGRVTDSDGTPIGGAMVHVFYYDVCPMCSYHYGWIETGDDGSYIITSLPAGYYTVRVTAEGYVGESYDDTYDRAKASPVEVKPGEDTPDIDFTLDQGGSISGCVTKSDLTPIEGARVDVFDYDSLSDRRWVGYGDGPPVKTDANGDYRFTSLPAGNCAVRVVAEGYYATEWYWDTYDVDKATKVEVKAGEDTPDIDFALDEGGTISGRVTDSDGTPIEGAAIHVLNYPSIPDRRINYGGWVPTDKEGYYVTNGLPEGKYAVQAIACGYYNEWYWDVYTEGEASPVEVKPGEDTVNTDFALEMPDPRDKPREAIDAGLEWLAGQMNLDGSWGAQYPLAKTALAVLKFESHATDQRVSPFAETYLYNDQVKAGLDYIFANAYTTGISPQPAGNPDGDGDDIGVFFDIPGEHPIPPWEGYPIYNTSMAMMAIAASNTPNNVVVVAGSAVDGWTYEEVLQDAVDYMAWAQTDSGFGRGGWNYSAMDDAGWRSDQSNSGWATLALAYAETAAPRGFGLDIPGFVKTELNFWIDYIQDDVDGDPDHGGAHYPSGPEHFVPVNILKTGNLLQQMAFVGDTEETDRVQDAINYLVRHWHKCPDPGWRGCPSCHQTTYATMKGLEALGIDTIDSIDWFQDFEDALLSEQAADGWWPVCRWDTGDRILSTEWALLTLQKVVPNRPPVADAVYADPDTLWPPNHKARDVTIVVEATDPDGPLNIVRITYSVADEYGIYDVAETDLPEGGVISLIAERDGKDKDGRVYTIIVTVYDAGGLSDSGSVDVVVPHDQGK